MDEHLRKHDHYSSRQTNNQDKELERHSDFRLKHFAGDVVYKVEGFLEKNKDTLFQDLKRLMYSSHNSVIRDLFPDGARDIRAVTKRPVTAGKAFKVR